MKIVIATPEAFPFSKTGGLADVSGSLPKALGKAGEETYLVIPFYRMTRPMQKQFKKTGKQVAVKVGDKNVTGEIWEGKHGKNVKVYLIENNGYFDRDGLYGNANGDWPDNAERFTFFAKATLELCKTFGIKPDIMHCHDWQTAQIPTYLKTTYKDDPTFAGTRVVFTIHNMSYQGLFPYENWNTFGFDNSLWSPNYLEFWGKINLMKGGIIFSDSVTTVSVKYSQEIQTQEFGCGLDGLLSEYKYKLTGITNGADYDEWDPAKDPFIISNYSRRSLAGKSKCKASLQKRFKLTTRESIPLIGMVTRIVDQKGFDLISSTIEDLFKRDLQLVILGTGEPTYHELLKKYQAKYPTKMGVEIAYDNKLAHQIEAGSDMFLMPSRFEPCGLNQMYSLKYGTIPIVTPVGGLEDTIKNVDPQNKLGNGFKMANYSKEALLNAIDVAISSFKKKSIWSELVSRAMACDFSWDHTAEQYVRLFQILRKNNLKNKKVIELHPDRDIEA
jgi:starch synthase